ncbi:MAG: potassium transporter KefA [Comamonadaceae bacterium CG_4_9_14_0_8_um_filter_60_18]|nr:MAG: potassium transporter KefA [Comamonadaceae bacterium CG_4_9_14_0_8_um_filter_60_18]
MPPAAQLGGFFWCHAESPGASFFWFFMQNLIQYFNTPLFTLGDKSVTSGSLLAGGVFLLVIWWLARLFEIALQRVAARHSDEPSTLASIHMFSRLLRYVVWLVGTLIGLNYLGIDLSNIAMLGSALAVGLGFGLQNIVSNFVSGVIILLERSLKVGDFVDLESGVRGHVREIAMRYTRITTNDSVDVLVPNSQFINNRVINWTHDDAFRRMHVPFGVAYGTRKELVQEAGLAAAKRVDGVQEDTQRQSAVWLVSYGDNAVNYELVVWVNRRLTTTPAGSHAKLMWVLDDELARRQIEIPFPQRDLHVRSGTLNVRLNSH